MASRDRPVNIFILGPSGSGKTRGAANLCKVLARPILLVNAPPHDYKGTGLPVTPVSWDELDSNWSNCTIVVEDIHALNIKQRETLAKICTYTSRHCSVNTILISHSIFRNFMFSLLGFMTHIYITRDRVNTRLLKTVLRHFCYSDVGEVEKAFFSLRPYNFLVLNILELGFAKVDSTMTPEENSTGTSLKQKVLAYFDHLDNRDQYSLIYIFLAANIPHESIRHSDLSVSVQTRQGQPLRFSLIDYIFLLNEPDVTPDPTIESFHRYLQSYVCIPRFLVKNRRMSALNR